MHERYREVSLRRFGRAVSIVIGLIVILSAVPGARAQTDDELATRFYPKALDDDFTANHLQGTEVTRLITTVRADLDGSGSEDYLAVAYSNGMGGCLRVIKGNGTNAAVVAEVGGRTLGGRGKPDLNAVDLENDGIAELVMQFSRASWIYRYANGTLSLLNPTRVVAGYTTTHLGNVTMADLDGDGVLEVLDYSSGRPDTSYIIYKLDHGKLVPASLNVTFFDRFQRPAVPPATNPQDQPTGKPVVEERRFSATPGDKYELRIVNGDQAKQSVVTSGEVRLNGATVVSPSDFKKTARTLSVPVKLGEDNLLTVELRGDLAADAEITLSIVRTQ